MLVVLDLMFNILPRISDSYIVGVVIYVLYIANCSINGYVYMLLNRTVRNEVLCIVTQCLKTLLFSSVVAWAVRPQCRLRRTRRLAHAHVRTAALRLLATRNGSEQRVYDDAHAWMAPTRRHFLLAHLLSREVAPVAPMINERGEF